MKGNENKGDTYRTCTEEKEGEKDEGVTIRNDRGEKANPSKLCRKNATKKNKI